MTTDREFLELAARAAGHSELIYCEFWKCMARWVEEDGGYFDSNSCWRPLTDDGDALRLAVKLKLTPIMRDFGCDVTDFVGLGVSYEPWSACPFATTRRAIVRAAAEIGKGIQQPKLEDVPEDNSYKLQAEAAEIGKTLA